MPDWAPVYFVIALIAAVYNSTGITSAAAGIAEYPVFVFMVLFVISFILGLCARLRAWPAGGLRRRPDAPQTAPHKGCHYDFQTHHRRNERRSA